MWEKPLLHSGMAQERPANVKAVTAKRPATRVLYVGKPLVHSGTVMERAEYVQLVIRGISVAKKKINRSHSSLPVSINSENVIICLGHNTNCRKQESARSFTLVTLEIHRFFSIAQ